MERGDGADERADDGDPVRSRNDLIQLEYRLHELLIDERLRARRSDSGAMAADFLGVPVSGVVEVARSVVGADIPSVKLILADLAGTADPSTLVGAEPSAAVTWSTVELGAERCRVPEYISIPCRDGSLASVPVYLQAWPKNHDATLFLRAYVRASDEAVVQDALDELLAAAAGPRSPYLHRLVEASAGQGGPTLRIVDLEPTERESLVLPPDVWASVHRNIDRMFERMERLDAAGLGTNRGMILAGPPGTGKSALCRSLAHDYVGRATVTIVSASAGQYVLGQLYEKLDRLAPALVLIEDLDLLVGDRGDRERFPLIQFLTVLDGLMTHHSRVVTIATTNDIDLVDAAASRAARFDQVVEIGLPDISTRAAILEVYLRRVDHGADVERLARETDGFSGADLREVVRSAVLDAPDGPIGHVDLMAAVALRRGHLEGGPSASYL